MQEPVEDNHVVDCLLLTLTRFQAANAKQVLPKVVRAAWRTTSPFKASVLSKICQVIAAIALARFGSIAIANQENALLFDAFPHRAIKIIAKVHSHKVAM